MTEVKVPRRPWLWAKDDPRLAVPRARWQTTRHQFVRAGYGDRERDLCWLCLNVARYWDLGDFHHLPDVALVRTYCARCGRLDLCAASGPSHLVGELAVGLTRLLCDACRASPWEHLRWDVCAQFMRPYHESQATYECLPYSSRNWREYKWLSGVEWLAIWRRLAQMNDEDALAEQAEIERKSKQRLDAWRMYQ